MHNNAKMSIVWSIHNTVGYVLKVHCATFHVKNPFFSNPYMLKQLLDGPNEPFSDHCDCLYNPVR